MVKHCCWGKCNTDTRYPDRLEGGVTFIPFPKPRRKYTQCLRWIKLCGRDTGTFNINKITKDTYVCSKHFIEGKPTKRFPDPVDALGTVTKPHRQPPKKRFLMKYNVNIDHTYFATPEVKTTSDPSSTSNIDVSHLIENNMDVGREEIVNNASQLNMTEDVENLKSKLTESMQKNLSLQQNVKELSEENSLLKMEIKALKSETSKKSECGPISPEKINNSCVTEYFKYCTGFPYEVFNVICKFVHIPSEPCSNNTNSPLKFHKSSKHIKSMPLRSQLLMVLMKLRNNFDMKDLAFRFEIDSPSVSVIFNSWINYLYFRLGQISIWPHRDVITEHMPEKFRSDYPSTMAIFDCTEIKMQRPTSLKLQSQCYSDYKSTTTLKSLVAIDPRGAVIFISSLYTGSISDKEIFKQCNIIKLLQELMQCNYLKQGDSVMCDKGFNIESELNAIGLNLNIPPFAKSGMQMGCSDVIKTKKIAHHRVHVERAIAKIKKFKIVSGTIPNSMLGNINKIWFVVSVLSNFQPNIIK